MNAIVKTETTALSVMAESDLINVLRSSLYPNAKTESIKLVLGYCKASGLDPMQKPVHIVPMWDQKSGEMRDVIMPGVGLYRTQAARTNECAGVGEPEFGEDVLAEIGGAKLTYPKWCRVVVKRRLPSGEIAEYSAKEFWLENYAVKGGKEKSIAPNAMWLKRPYGQIAKCAQAQALRTAFPECGAAPTAEEMEGKTIDMGMVEQAPDTPLEHQDLLNSARDAAMNGTASYAKWFAENVEGRKCVTYYKKHKEYQVAAAEIDQAQNSNSGVTEGDGSND